MIPLPRLMLMPPAHRVECAWCWDVISPGVEPVSHSICPECRRTYFPEIFAPKGKPSVQELAVHGTFRGPLEIAAGTKEGSL